MKSRYFEAGIWLADELESMIQDGNLDFPSTTFADLVIVLAPGIQINRYEGKIHYSITDPMAGLLTNLSESEPTFYDVCSEICSTNLFHDQPLPLHLRYWLGNVVLGKLARPTSKGRPRVKQFLEKMHVFTITSEVVKKFELKLTRDSIGSSRFSACDAVAQALTVCGRKTRYNEICNLMTHGDHSRLRKEFRAAAALFNISNETAQTFNALHPEYASLTTEQASRSFLTICETFPADKE